MHRYTCPNTDRETSMTTSSTRANGCRANDTRSLSTRRHIPDALGDKRRPGRRRRGSSRDRARAIAAFQRARLRPGCSGRSFRSRHPDHAERERVEGGIVHLVQGASVGHADWSVRCLRTLHLARRGGMPPLTTPRRVANAESWVATRRVVMRDRPTFVACRRPGAPGRHALSAPDHRSRVLADRARGVRYRASGPVGTTRRWNDLVRRWALLPERAW